MHQVPIFDERRGSLRSACEFPTLIILLFWLLIYPLKWNVASSVKNKLESAIYTIKPNTFKLLKHMNNDITESAHVNPGPSKETFYIIMRNYGLLTLFKKITGIQKM
jgi:hypothetical protein